MSTPTSTSAHPFINGNAAPKAMADVVDHAATLMALGAACSNVQGVQGSHHITVPPGYMHKDITAAVEAAQGVRRRKQGTVKLKSAESLLAYLADQGAAHDAYVYANPDSCTITAVFNDQRGTDAGWRDHRAEFAAELTPEFKNWRAYNKQPKTQTEFAEFIEDNLADITEPAAQALLDVATTIQATTGINFASAKRLHNGQTQLTYSETIDARAGANGALEIPKEFALGLRIFKNGAGYKLRARLKYRLAGGAVKFWYELDRPERAVEDAFAAYVKQIQEGSSYRVLLGEP